MASRAFLILMTIALPLALASCSKSENAAGGGAGAGAGGGQTGAAGGGAGGRRGPQGPAEVGFIVVKSEDVPLVTELAGRTAAYEVSEVRPQAAGIIQARLFTEGSIVHKGQTLYRIDPRIYQAAAAQARANLASANATQAAAQVRADRYKPLADMEAVSKQDYTDALASARQASAAVAQNRALLATANVNLGFTRVPAPITGRIGRSLFTTGALVSSAQTSPLAVIQRLDPIFVDIQQSSGDVLALRRKLADQSKGAADVRLQLEDGSDYPLTGKIEFAEAVVDPATGTVTLRARFSNPDGLLLPGMYVRAKLVQSVIRNAILVPQGALSRDASGQGSVLLVGPGNKAVKQTVVSTVTSGQSWVVTSGLKPGDKVITEGLIRARPDQVVKPVPAGSKPRGGPGGRGGSAGGAGDGAGGGAGGAGAGRRQGGGGQ